MRLTYVTENPPNPMVPFAEKKVFSCLRLWPG